MDQKDFETFYTTAKKAYLKVFTRLGLVAKVTEASGGAFSEKVSYEFEVLTDAGEAPILYCTDCDYCVNVDDIKTYKEGDPCPICGKATLQSAMASEVGNVFDLGTKYSKAFDLTATNEKGEKVHPIMGCYGIGISRTMGVIVEKFNDERGIIWPAAIAPFTVHLASLAGKSDEIVTKADELYNRLTNAGIEVLYDDRKEAGAGAKLADADLIGCPVRLVVSAKTGDKIEMKKRSETESQLVTFDDVVSAISHL